MLFRADTSLDFCAEELRGTTVLAINHEIMKLVKPYT